MPKLKTYRYAGPMTPTALREEWDAEKRTGTLRSNASIRQCEIIIGAPTKKRAAELLGVSTRDMDHHYKSYEPGDPMHPAAEMQPETPLYRPLDFYDENYRLWTLIDGIPGRADYDPAAAKLRALAVKLYAAHEQFTTEHAQQQIDRFAELAVQWERTARAATEHFEQESKR